MTEPKASSAVPENKKGVKPMAGVLEVSIDFEPFLEFEESTGFAFGGFDCSNYS